MTQLADPFALEVLVDAADDRDTTIIAEGLAGIGRITRTAIASIAGRRMDFDLVMIACEEATPALFETVRTINVAAARPIVMFAARCDGVGIDAAIESGISAFVVDGLKAERVPPIIRIARARFRAERTLRTELERARSDLAARKTIERAKGILMERRKLSEAEAYDFLRRCAMEDRRTIAEIADVIMTADRLMAV